MKNVFSNIGTTFGKVGEGLAGKPTGQPAQARPIPVRRKVQPSMQTITQQPQGFDFAKMMGFDNSAPQQTQISQTRVRDARMRAVKRKLKNSKRLPSSQNSGSSLANFWLLSREAKSIS